MSNFDCASLIPAGFNWKHPLYDEVFNQRQARLLAMRQDPALVAGCKALFKSNPGVFIASLGMTFDPRNVELGISPTAPFLLFPRQAEFVDWVVARWRSREDGLVEKSRDMGASWLCVSVAVWMWLFYPGTVIGFGSRKEAMVDSIGDPSSLFWKIRQFIELLPREFRPQGWDAKKHAPYMRVLNPENGASIIGEAGDNIGRGARTSVYFVDEAAFIDRPDTIEAALSQTSNCRIHVSTPNGVGNPFYRKRHGGKVPVFIFDWTQDPRKDQAWYERQKERLDPSVVAAEIDRNYEASITDAFVPGNLVTEAIQRGPFSVPAIGRLRVGVDVARFGDDKSALAIRRGRVLLRVLTMGGLDVTQVASWVRTELAAFNEIPEQIAVDTIGIGAGVADVLRGWYGPLVQDVNASVRISNGQDYNLRAFMWREMREWLKSAGLPNDEDLRVDLTALRYLYRGGELLLESKDDAKKRGVKSPDRADAVAMTFAVPGSAEDAMSHPIFHSHRGGQAGRVAASRVGY